MAGNIKPRPLHVVEKGYFNKNGSSWSSEQCHAIIKYLPRKDDIIMCRVYGQKSKRNPEEGFVHPHFPKDTMQRLLNYARRRHQEGYVRNTGHRGKHHKLKGHRKDLCEKCEKCEKLEKNQKFTHSPTVV